MAPTRRLILALALRLGWAPSEVERLTFAEVAYIIDELGRPDGTR